MADFPAVIDLSALDGTDGFRIAGVAAFDRSGYSVASAGDVNGDGIDDLIIGAWGADPNGVRGAGVSYVVFGSNAGGAADFDLAGLDGTTGFRINGVGEYDRSGTSVASAGDVNGDGIDDLIIGAPGAFANGSYSGASYVVFGSAAGFAADFELSGLNGTNGFRISGEEAGQRIGRSVASAGDVNGDGYADLIMGVYGVSPNGVLLAGASYVVFGGSGGFAADFALSDLDGTNGFRINGAAAYDFSGQSVASAGDVNGDGYDDLIIGATGADPNGVDSGASFVVFGSNAGFGASLELSGLDGNNGFRINGVAAYDVSGRSVASAGDVNNDGFDDLIIGATGADPVDENSGSSYLVFGRAAGFGANLELSSLDGTNGFRIDGAAKYDDSGISVASAGDINGDGFDDLIIGATGADPGGGESGAAYVVFGAAAGFGAHLNLLSLNGTNGFRIDGLAMNDQTGRSVASAGDVNSDGFDDLIVGAEAASPNGSLSGVSYVIFGQAASQPVIAAGTVGGDSFTGGARGDQLDGAGGNDLLSGLGGDDRLDGGIGGDKLFGGAGADRLDGGADNDRLEGGEGTDTLLGGSGNDQMDGGAGADIMTGGGDNDVYIVDDAGDQTVELGGEGYDIVRTAVDGWVLAANLEGLQLQGSADIAGSGNDGANNIQGNSGANTLSGGLGVDTINGNDGDDTIIGGLGNDLLRGGLGADIFVVAHVAGGVLESDQIYDFSGAEGDILDLSGAFAGVLSKVDTFTKVAGQMTLAFAGGITTVRLDTTGDGKVDHQLRINGDVTGDYGDWLL